MTSGSSLVAFLRGIRRREEYESSGDEYHKVITGLTMNRIKYLGGKIEEIDNSLKKYEKVSFIYKSIVGWIALFNNLASNLGEFLQKQE